MVPIHPAEKTFFEKEARYVQAKELNLFFKFDALSRSPRGIEMASPLRVLVGCKRVIDYAVKVFIL